MKRNYLLFCSLFLLFVSNASFADIIIDNTSSASSRVGNWQTSGASGYYNTGSVWGSDGATFTWNFTPSQTGQHSVSMWWAQWSTRGTSIPVDIKLAGGTARVYVNQQTNGGKWNLLGTYSFNSGTSYYVKITAPAYPITTCADAVKIAYAGGSSPPPPSSGDIIIDNTSSSSSRVGNWQTSGASGYYKTGSVWAADGATFTWNFTPSQTGQHSVSMWWAQWSTRGTSIPVDIKHAGGTARVYVNQRTNGGKWNVLGTYSFNSGTSYYVKIIAPAYPATTCADAVKISYTGSGGGGGGGGGGSTGTQRVFISLAYNPENVTGKYTSALKNLGATKQGDEWSYTRSGKTYRIQFASSISALRTALATSGAVIVVEGHSNYGLGLVFATDTEIKNQTIYGVRYIDDPRIFQMTPKWVAIDVKDFIREQAYPNWWPKFSNGSSGVMPYTFSQGTPPYNYYISYKIGSTYYKIETAHRSAMQRFPDCGKTPWFSSTGAEPSPSNSSHTKHFITNSGGYTGGYTKPHYAAKTIIFTKGNTLGLADLKYSKLILNSCGSGYQYGEPFRHGVFFYTMGSVYGDNGVIFLRSYLEGKSDYNIWRDLQNKEPIYDYFDFSKTPSAQLSTTSLTTLKTQAIEQPIEYAVADINYTRKISEMNELSAPQILDELEDDNFVSDDDLMIDAIAGSLGNKEEQAVNEAIERIRTFNRKRFDPAAARYRPRKFYSAKKVVNFFADVSADKLIKLCDDKDPFVRGNAVNAAGELSDIPPVKNRLIKALDDKSASEEQTPETFGWPLRVCDMAYNQLVLYENIENVLRAIGTGLAIEDRNYHIDILKQKLQPQQR